MQPNNSLQTRIEIIKQWSKKEGRRDMQPNNSVPKIPPPRDADCEFCLFEEITALTDTAEDIAIAEQLAAREDNLDLFRLRELGCEAAKSLAKHRHLLTFLHLVDLSPEAANAIANKTGMIAFHVRIKFRPETWAVLANRTNIFGWYADRLGSRMNFVSLI